MIYTTLRLKVKFFFVLMGRQSKKAEIKTQQKFQPLLVAMLSAEKFYNVKEES